MRSTYTVVLGVIVLFVVGSIGWSASSQQGSATPAAQRNKATTATAEGAQSDVERGRYLVEDIAMCGECHTPRDSNGDLDQSRWLQGASIWIMPVQHNSSWAMHAPALAGLPYSEQQAENVLERGVGANGETIQPPMHIYHMHHADAMAIIAYLRSLPPSTNIE